MAEFVSVLLTNIQDVQKWVVFLRKGIVICSIEKFNIFKKSLT